MELAGRIYLINEAETTLKLWKLEEASKTQSGLNTRSTCELYAINARGRGDQRASRSARVYCSRVLILDFIYDIFSIFIIN